MASLEVTHTVRLLILLWLLSPVVTLGLPALHYVLGGAHHKVRDWFAGR